MLAYLRIIVNPLDQEALLRVINFPRRGIGEAALDILTEVNRKNGLSLWSVLESVAKDNNQTFLKETAYSKAIKGIKDFLNIIETAKNHFETTSLKESLTWLIERIQYQKALNEEVKSAQMREFKWENVEEFVSSIANFEKCEKGQESEKRTLDHFVLELPLSNDFNKGLAKAENENKVSLMTFHGAKGLEFPACFLVGMEDHIIPHEKSLKQTGIEEERRLIYVAITRAMKFLTISMARKRMRMGVEASSIPSRFITEIPRELLKITEWHCLT